MAKQSTMLTWEIDGHLDCTAAVCQEEQSWRSGLQPDKNNAYFLSSIDMEEVTDMEEFVAAKTEMSEQPLAHNSQKGLQELRSLGCSLAVTKKHLQLDLSFTKLTTLWPI